MNKLINRMNSSTATAGTVMLAFLFALVPNTVRAIEFPGVRNPATFGIKFDIETSVENTNSTMIGKFPNAIRDFGVFTVNRDGNPTFPDTKRESLDLEVTLVEGQIDDIEFPDVFKKFSRPIYEYSFNVSIAPFIDRVCDDSNRSDSCSEFKFLGIERVSWFVPSEFTYEDTNSRSFSISSDDCSFIPANYLKCLEKILNKAAENGIAEINFPTNNPPFDKDDPGNIRVVRFPTTSVPEANASNSLLVLAFLGMITFLKGKI